jgi:hypothetical protein
MNLKMVMVLAYTVAIPAIVGSIIYITRKDRADSITILSLLFISAFAFELLATASRVYFNNNILILNLSSVAEGWFLLYFLRSLLRERIRPLYLNLFIAGAILVTGIALLEFIIKGIDFFNVSYTLKNVLIIAGILLVFFEVAKGLNMSRWLYYTLGVFLFYFASNFIFFLVVSPSLDIDILHFLYDIHNIINALINVFFGFALWKLSATKSLLSHSLF